MKKEWLLLLFIGAACSSPRKTTTESEMGIPACVQQLVKEMEKAPKQNPPGSIYRYRYNNQTVYYVSAACCDQYSDLYDSACNLVSHPDGGFTGKGDGKTPDFKNAKADGELIWKDIR